MENESIAVLERELDESLAAHARSIAAPPRVDAFALMLDRERGRALSRKAFVVVGAAAASLVGVGAVAALGGDAETVVVAQAEASAGDTGSTLPPATVPSSTAPVATTPPTTRDTTPPALAITAPAEGAVVATKSVTVTGIAEPGAKLVFGELRGEAGADGGFAFDTFLAPGPNRLVVRASDAAGNVAEAAIDITFEPPPPPTTKPVTTTTVKPVTTTTAKTTESAFAFTMNQKWYKCETNPPFEEFYGTATPGSTVTVASAHGGGSTTVDAKGKWYLKVVFPTAPKNVYFEGTVSSAQGSKPFRFKYYVPAG